MSISPFPACGSASSATAGRSTWAPHVELVDQRRENQAILEGWQFSYLGWADRQTPVQARKLLEAVVARRVRDLGLPL